MKRRSLLSLAAGSTALTTLAHGDFVSNLDKKRLPALDTTFRKFLADTVELRKGMMRIGPDADENNRIAQKMEPIATAAFLKGAENGDRRHQFYYGRLFQELHWLTKNEAYARQSERWFTAADKQNHPGAAWHYVARMPSIRDKDLCGRYKRAIRLGSVSALAACSGSNQMMLQDKDWMDEGPVISAPYMAGVDTWAEVYFNWMLIYHFLIRWDKDGKFFRLSLPNTQTLEFMAGTMEPSDGIEEKVGFDVIRELTKKAALEASLMDIDFYPEEIYNYAWDKIFRFD